MSRTQTRRSVSLRPSYYNRFHERCEMDGKSKSGQLTKLIEEYLDAAEATQREARAAAAPARRMGASL